MRSSIRVLRRIAFLSAVGVVQLTGCVGDGHRDGSGESARAGSVHLPLTSTSRNGNTYRLHALFLIQDERTGTLVDILTSDRDGIFSPEVRAELDAGNYTITIDPGWRLERLGGGDPGTGGTPGTGGFAGEGGAVFTGGRAGVAGRGGAGGRFGMGGTPGTGTAGTPGKRFPFEPITPEPPFTSFESAGAGGAVGVGGGGDPVDPPIFGGTTGVGGQPGFPMGGTAEGGGFPTAGTGSGQGVFVQAQLVNDETQFFTIFGDDNVFINYQFKVGDDIVPFDRGTVRVGFTVDDDDACVSPPGLFNPERVMLEHAAGAFEGVRLSDVFGAIVGNEGHESNPALLYQRIFDSFATADQGRLPDAIHCGDERTGGSPTLNGFPITCNRSERLQIDNIDTWTPTAFINRLDLAPQNGAHCGQQRMIFATNAQNRAFLIFEAQIPNPVPELGLKACVPLADFWLAQNEIADAGERGRRLTEAFFNGDPDLAAAGFGPFLKASHFTVGSGQIRTNSFDDSPWTLREFKLALDGEDLTVRPFPVGESPNGALWDESLPTPQGELCRQNFISAALGGLLTDNPSAMSFVVDQQCKNSESRNDGSEAYPFRMGPGFRTELDEVFLPLGLTGRDIATRAQFAGSCIGCHQEAVGARLGGGMNAPFSLGFVHVDEQRNISDGLRNVFLPQRLSVVAALAGVVLPPDPCQGQGGATGTGGAVGVGGTNAAGFPGFPQGGVSTDPGDGTPPPKAAPAPVPAPHIEISLPQASVPVEELERADAQIREAYGDKTLGGKDARVTH